MEIVTKSGMELSFPGPQKDDERSTEYWCDGVLAYYQWKSGGSFKEILEDLPMGEIVKLYGTLHEASEDKFVDVAEAIRKKKRRVPRLQLLRPRRGWTQKELAEKSGVDLRTLLQ